MEEASYQFGGGLATVLVMILNPDTGVPAQEDTVTPDVYPSLICQPSTWPISRFRIISFPASSSALPA